jgi:hypothetical protein
MVLGDFKRECHCHVSSVLLIKNGDNTTIKTKRKIAPPLAAPLLADDIGFIRCILLDSGLSIKVERKL